MANLSLRHLYKVYPNGVKAVSDFNMEIQDKEFIVFVGPSGCGKSTTLRMIAGLEDITAGELFIADTLVNDMEPKDRDVAMVFQNYALYPHLTVYENMAFGLRLRNVPEDDVHRKVLWAAEILKLTDYLDRKPKALSGGQRQRVALGRAILRNPKVFLLDEPLSNLDAKLRTEMRSEIAKLHKELQTTFIYVTHDQVEAMTMGTRIVVMKLGRIQQIDSPTNLYRFPANKFVAGFIGTPQMNFFSATMRRDHDTVTIKIEGADDVFTGPFNDFLKIRPKFLNGLDRVTMGIRCEHFSIDPEVVKTSANAVKVKISHFEELGAETLIYGDLNMKGDGYSETGTRVIIKSYKGTAGLKPGDVAVAAVDVGSASFFDPETEKTVVPRIPEVNIFDCAVKDDTLDFLGTQVRLPSAMKCPDLDKAELFVPVEALQIGGSDLEASVQKIEEINGVKIVYLEKNGRVFFLLDKRDFAIGEKVRLGLDYKRLSVEKEGQMYLSPFSENDTFVGAFTNFENESRSLKALASFERKTAAAKIAAWKSEEIARLGEISFQKVLYKQDKKELKAKIAGLKSQCSYRIGTEEVGKEGKKRIKAETLAAIALAKKDYAGKIKGLDALKAFEEKLSGPGKAALEAKQKAIGDHFEALIHNETGLLAENLSLIEKGRDSMRILKPRQLEEERKGKEEIKKLLAAFKDESAKIAAAYDKAIAERKADFEKAKGDEKDQAKIKFLSLKNAKKKALADAEAAFRLKEDETLFSHKIFFAYIKGMGIVTDAEISKKIVKSLGIALFTSQFRFEIPHEAYALAKKGENGVEAKILEKLDFGTGIYARCDTHGNEIYAKITADLSIGSIVHLIPDLSKAHISENRFDIRLY
jgi:multiple sugar transport system ATP-binding protein